MELTRLTEDAVTLLCDTNSQSGVTFAFSERCGGVSKPPYNSLNLGTYTHDDPSAIASNQHKLLGACKLEAYANNLIVPQQVHGDTVVVLDAKCAPALHSKQWKAYLANMRHKAQAGADAIVCNVEGVPSYIVTADCVPLILVCGRAYAVVHSGWKGTLAKICNKALLALCDLSNVAPQQVEAYVGPHIQVQDYEVSPELAQTFISSFNLAVVQNNRNLNLGAAIQISLQEAGIPQENIFVSTASTAAETNRFFSYRACGPETGRMAALACIPPHEKVA